jgi:hypothetical protein
VTYSAAIGSEPTALALAADASVLYVGLDGSGEIARLALPSMVEQARMRLPKDFIGRSAASAIAVSPADATVAAVSLRKISDSGLPGTGLLRDMVLQPQLTTGGEDPVLAFDASGGMLYQSAFAFLRQLQVLADGLSEQAFVDFTSHSLAFVNNLVIAGGTAYDVSGLAVVGTVSGASNCLVPPAVLVCLTAVDPFALAAPRVLVADPTTFVIGKSLLVSPALEPYPLTRRFVPGPSGQVAISYRASSFVAPKVRLFSSAQLP